MTKSPTADASAPEASAEREAAPALTWVVIRRLGLTQLPAADAAKAVKSGSAREATERDFRIAGIDPTA